MKLSDLDKAVKSAKQTCKKNKIKDPDVIIDLDKDGGYYDLENLQVASTDDGDIVINLKSSNEV